ncbi:MAG: PhnD/SsuA/transferrin family substrate-binding protein [Xanthobacteraceae bacterium]
MQAVAIKKSSAGKIFAHDVNLGFPLDHPDWADFFSARGWRTAAFDDMGKLTATLKSHAAAAAFLPAANYFHVRNDPAYAGLASGLAMKTGGTTVSSVLIVRKTSTARSILDLKGARLGYINAYCTTSFFAPAILLSEHGVAFDGFFSIKPTGAWQRQIDSVLTGEVDATMVEEDIWLDKPANHASTKIIGRVERLPGPLVVLAQGIDATFASTFLTKLRATKTAKPHQPFAGYAAYCSDVVRDFFARCECAFPAVA